MLLYTLQSIKPEIDVAVYYYRSSIWNCYRGIPTFWYASSWSVINRALITQGLYILLISGVFIAAESADDSNDSDDEFQICQICSGEDVRCF